MTNPPLNGGPQGPSQPRPDRPLRAPQKKEGWFSQTVDTCDCTSEACDLGCDACLLTSLSMYFSILFRSPGPTPNAPRGLAGWLWRRFRAYQVHVSAKRPPRCPMTPTCSRYGLDAVARYGALRGGWLTLRRLLRCGRTTDRIDPVPN